MHARINPVIAVTMDFGCLNTILVKICLLQALDARYPVNHEESLRQISCPLRGNITSRQLPCCFFIHDNWLLLIGYSAPFAFQSTVEC